MLLLAGHALDLCEHALAAALRGGDDRWLGRSRLAGGHAGRWRCRPVALGAPPAWPSVKSSLPKSEMDERPSASMGKVSTSSPMSLEMDSRLTLMLMALARVRVGRPGIRKCEQPAPSRQRPAGA